MDLSIKLLIPLFLAINLLACETEPEDRSIGTDMVGNPATMRDGKKSDEKAEMTFEETVYEAGRIAQGEVISFSYPFTNTGNHPLVISSALGSCGCTVARNYPKGKIMPGEGGEIEVEFDSDNKFGKQTVTVSVAANTIPASNQLKINVEVMAPNNIN